MDLETTDLETTLAPFLSTLCQQYLLTFSATDGSPDMDRSHRMYDIVNRALHLMGWRVSKFGDAAFISREAFLRKRDSVTRVSWWAFILEGVSWSEQEVISSIGPYTNKLLEKLLSRVSSDALSKDPEMTLDIVAPAYLELHDFLSRSEKREIILLQKPSCRVTIADPHLSETGQPASLALVHWW